jgi:hypothetical protein
MRGNIAIASVVTEAFLDEFAILKYSFELFHGTACHWCVRCDRASASVLSGYDNVSCVIFAERAQGRPDTLSESFRHIVAEKMNAMNDAWLAPDGCRGVLFLDADILFTAPLLPALDDIDGDVILTPNYYPEVRQHLASVHGEYNGGFAFTRSREFHAWWEGAYAADSSRYNEQSCLNEAHERFAIGRLGERANIGFWRTAEPPRYDEIPADCQFLHVHLYQRLDTMREWIDKSFALHCLKFLSAGVTPQHRLLFDRILAADRHGWFESSLRLCGLWQPGHAVSRP